MMTITPLKKPFTEIHLPRPLPCNEWVPVAPTGNQKLDPDDNRRAVDIASNALFDVFNHLPTHVVKAFYKQVGGNWNDKSLPPNHRARAAANAERVLEYIDKAGGIASLRNNHRIEGTHQLYAGGVQHAANGSTEAERLHDFAQFGYQGRRFRDPIGLSRM